MLLDARAGEGGGSLTWGREAALRVWVPVKRHLCLNVAPLGLLSVFRCQGFCLGVAFRGSSACTSETALSAPAWFPLPFKPYPALSLPSHGGAEVASTSAISPARGRSPQAQRRKQGRVGQLSEPKGGAGRAGGQAGERRGAGALLGSGAAARPAPARLSAGSEFFRERLPWVTRLRGDTALPPPSGNLSIREIDNPQRRAAHPLRSPSSGESRPKVAPLVREGSMSGPLPPPWTPPQPAAGAGVLCKASMERFRGTAWGGPFRSLTPSLSWSETKASISSRAAGTRGAPWRLGQNFVQSRPGLFLLSIVWEGGATAMFWG